MRVIEEGQGPHGSLRSRVVRTTSRGTPEQRTGPWNSRRCKRKRSRSESPLNSPFQPGGFAQMLGLAESFRAALLFASPFFGATTSVGLISVASTSVASTSAASTSGASTSGASTSGASTSGASTSAGFTSEICYIISDDESSTDASSPD